MLGYLLWRYQFLNFREYTPCRAVPFSSQWHSDEVCERAAQKPSDSGFGDLGTTGGWHDGGARYVAALGGDLV